MNILIIPVPYFLNFLKLVIYLNIYNPEFFYVFISCNIIFRISVCKPECPFRTQQIRITIFDSNKISNGCSINYKITNSIKIKLYNNNPSSSKCHSNILVHVLEWENVYLKKNYNRNNFSACVFAETLLVNTSIKNILHWVICLFNLISIMIYNKTQFFIFNE